MPNSTHPLRRPEIGAETRLIPVLGDPIAQVRAPALMNGLLAERGVDTVVIPVHARAENLDSVVRGLQAIENVRGLLITVPHKIDILRHAAVHSPAAALAGSANALRREPDGSWHAANFDGAGFVAGLVAHGFSPAGRQVAVIGAGGAGSAVSAALLDAEASRLTVYDRDGDRMIAIVDRLGSRWPGRVEAGAGLGAADIVINATPLGLGPTDELPFDPACLRPGALVADIVMRPRRTRLLRLAETLGHPVHYGEPMLTHQVELYCAYFGLAAEELRA
ncbi:shikimate dehydrogenase family protein [Nocardia bovistercoris]|uniref:Shikimate dehydrogenase n=1 Tax=Nocardia bovistercoris TaxID=2785916 RepID=A0A931N5F3_9NOCA|nr:shikimate dehydrogenase [Nocardia bovistercoris]MBH0779662.1 shikimate dehydrogenase [Nocardia bovistercoris]